MVPSNRKQQPLFAHNKRYDIQSFSETFIHIDKTIKMWKCVERQEKKVVAFNLNGSLRKGPLKEVKLPQVNASGNSSIVHIPKKVYANAHAYHINSISLNSDGDTFISADDLRVNLWHKDHTRDSMSMFQMLLFFLTYCSHCGYQTTKHGGFDRGDHFSQIPSQLVQYIHVQQQ